MAAYELRDPLARICLPQAYRDACRTLAWANSICALFLLVGLMGLKAPKSTVHPSREPRQIVPVVWTLPEEPGNAQLPVQSDSTELPPVDNAAQAPEVVTALEAVDPSAIAFPVTVPNALPVAEIVAVPQAAPPATGLSPPAQPSQFTSRTELKGIFPDPEYPAAARRNGYEGTVLIEIMVDEAGTIASARIFKTSGYAVLDEAALRVVQRRWWFPPGPKRWLHWPCHFKIQ